MPFQNWNFEETYNDLKNLNEASPMWLLLLLLNRWQKLASKNFNFAIAAAFTAKVFLGRWNRQWGGLNLPIRPLINGCHVVVAKGRLTLPLLLLLFSVTCVIVSLTLFLRSMLRYTNDQQLHHSCHLVTFGVAYWYLDMSTFNSVTRCMHMLHKCLQVD
jgi:hypothetical protein